ncbi:hypothetical protein ACMAZH_09395 [Arenicellales bacterium nBUS_45]
MTDSKLSGQEKAETSGPTPNKKKKVTSSPPRGRGKMYWKFAAIEGWKADKAELPLDISPKKK